MSVFLGIAALFALGIFGAMAVLNQIKADQFAERLRQVQVQHIEVDFNRLVQSIVTSSKEEALRDAAQAYTSIEEKGRRQELSWTKTRSPGSALGPETTVPMWLNDRADRIAGISTEDGS